MHTQPVNLTLRQEPSSGTFPVRWSSWMWENLNLSSSGHDYSLLKIVGIAVVLGILGLAYKAYKARTGGSSGDLGITSPSSASSLSLQTSEAEKKKPLPNGVQEGQVREMIQIFTNHFKAFENPKIAADHGADPTKVTVGPVDVERMCKKLVRYDYLFDYLKEKEVINSYKCLRVNAFEVVLSEKFVQTLKAPGDSQ